MKTAMQVLIEELKHVEEWPMMSGIIKRANDLLEKEKEHFNDMFEEGFESAYQHFVNGKDFINFEEYYNQTYNQNK